MWRSEFQQVENANMKKGASPECVRGQRRNATAGPGDWFVRV